MKILNISYSDYFGGAAKSAYRIHSVINSINNIKSDMLVIKKLSKNKNIFNLNKKNLLLFKLKSYFGILVSKFDSNINPKSYNFFNSPFLNFINHSNYDLINIHWINAETLSVDDIKKINKPFIITMHDMWWICGSENYLQYGDNRWKKGKFQNYISDHIYKKKKTVTPKAIISPSKWLINCVKDSPLFKKTKLINIPYPIDQKIFLPKNLHSLKKFNMFKNSKIKIFFGVFGNAADKRKGLDLLIKSLQLIDPSLFELIIASKNEFDGVQKFKIQNLNYIENEKDLSNIFNLCDLLVLSSRLDNLPNIALEAQSCGKPIVAYNVGGIPDIVKNNYNGYLIEPFKFKLFSKKLELLIKNSKQRSKFSINAAKYAKQNWSHDSIKKKYKQALINIS